MKQVVIQIVAGCIIGNALAEYTSNHVLKPIKNKIQGSKKES